ncbi:hypothetical protein EVAR_86231_1 [Eumeta japonica]|uniref:Uncharacterized protein n=1 Tax=Eumeta variegata TaxID=151549 RepID=A0A4C1UD61_EUMVA|nr:hypothetical protein EVAR_86231_1 [Eumeta japonica]
MPHVNYRVVGSILHHVGFGREILTESARRPLPPSEEVPVPIFCSTCELSFEENFSNMKSGSDFGGTASIKPKTFIQEEVNDLIRDLDLPEESAEILASRLREKKLLALGTKVTAPDVAERADINLRRNRSNLITGYRSPFPINHRAGNTPSPAELYIRAAPAGAPPRALLRSPHRDLCRSLRGVAHRLRIGAMAAAVLRVSGRWNHRRTDILGTTTFYYKKLYGNNKKEKEIDLANAISVLSILEAEVEKAIDTQSVGKTPGSDGINNGILRYVINKWNDDGEEEKTAEVGERNENEAFINTGRLSVKNIRFKLFTQKV